MRFKAKHKRLGAVPLPTSPQHSLWKLSVNRWPRKALSASNPSLGQLSTAKQTEVLGACI